MQASINNMTTSPQTPQVSHSTISPSPPSASILPPNKLQLLETVAQLSPEKRENLVYVVSHLVRASTSDSWGLAFSRLENHRIIFGRVQHHAHQIGSSQTIFSRTSTLLPHHLSSEVVTQHSVRQLATPCPIHQRLLPGDLLVAVDGRDPASFASLDVFTSYMKNCLRCDLVVLRHPDATGAAMGFHLPQRAPIDPHQASTMANTVWDRFFASRGPWSAPYAYPSTPYPSHVRRQVTPDHVPYTPLQSNSSADVARPPPRSSPWITHQQWAALARKPPTKKPVRPSLTASPKVNKLPVLYRNPWFQDDAGVNIPFDDNWEFSPEDGERAKLFLPEIANFEDWLANRKTQWRATYKVHSYKTARSIAPSKVHHVDDEWESEPTNVAQDFWTPQGYLSFDEWMSSSLEKWKYSYSWNKKTRKRIQQQCEEVVHISQDPGDFHYWLRIRRNQWRLLRRKRQRSENHEMGDQEEESNVHHTEDTGPRKRRQVLSPVFSEIVAIDTLLQAEEIERTRRQQNREQLDISFLFDATKGAPDDIVVHCLSFLEPAEHSLLLCISKSTSNALQARDDVWRQLCPQHWILPRRPRKPWVQIYFDRLRLERRNSQKRWDDLLTKCSTVLAQGDLLQKIEKLVAKGEEDFGFHVNYVSPVVCERNSLVNLAVINQRHKVVRWLVDQKGADIESYDRGHFTALLNAAWAGDRHLVRFLMQRGADRTKIGFGHYTKALAHPDFKGLTAEGWASKRGHEDIAKLIRLGL